MRSQIAYSMALLAVLIGCQTSPAATTEAPPGAPPTEAPPESTSVPPTATESPTATPVPVTPSATPIAAQSDLIGAWQIFDRDAGGYDWMVFGEDGSLLVGHGPAEDPLWLHSGQYAVDTGVLTFLDGWDNVCPDNPEQTGRYQVRLLNKNESMYLDVIEELCLTRDEVFHGLRWDRADMPRLP